MNPALHLVGVYMEVETRKKSKLISVSDRNVQNAAVRLLPNSNKLVSAEVEYVRRALGDKATQTDIDNTVLHVRQLSWSEIVSGQ